ncbi:ABC transporter permease subunit [Haloimpatiens sp. FM7315]|uniref:ABC transporter permease subunit n=1 Tax=Haloimpatiens sp. FM7315 TaxID=3298609 RepID=UPI0035A39D3A
MNIILFKREFKGNYKLILIFIAVITLYSSMIVAMFDPKLGESLEIMSKSMPNLFSAFGMSKVSTTLTGFISTYLYGFILIAFPLIFIIILSNRLVALYVDKGSMAYILATPNKRRKIVLTQGLFMAISILILVIYAVLICIVVSEIMFPGKLNIKNFIFINIGLYGLLFFFGGLCFLSSCSFSDTRFSYGFGGGFSVLFVLINMLSQVGEKFENLKYLTPLTLFQSDKLGLGDTNVLKLSFILYIIGLLLYCVGGYIFTRRDLSL